MAAQSAADGMGRSSCVGAVSANHPNQHFRSVRCTPFPFDAILRTRCRSCTFSIAVRQGVAVQRRHFLVASFVALTHLRAFADQNLPRIGVLSTGTDPNPKMPSVWPAFFGQLAELGFVEAAILPSSTDSREASRSFSTSLLPISRGCASIWLSPPARPSALQSNEQCPRRRLLWCSSKTRSQ
jgi:hypothetical protein